MLVWGASVVLVCDVLQFKHHTSLLVTSHTTRSFTNHTCSFTGPQQHVYRLVCKELGEQTVTLVVGNGPTTKNVFPANDSATVRQVIALASCNAQIEFT